MKKSFCSLFVAAIVSLTVVCAHAAETASEAVVLKVKGSAQATLPGQSQATTLKVGDKLPQGTVIKTPGSSEVEIQAFSGSVTTIKPGSTVDLNKLSLTTDNGAVTKQTAVIDIKVGSVVASLDPSKKAINDYSIRTPKGVAAARGTVYTVYVALDGSVRVSVSSGSITFTSGITGQPVTVQPGYSVTITPDGAISEPTPTTSNEIPTTPTSPNNETIDPTIPNSEAVVSPSS
ncbi:MAG: FecR domain-containing protein [Rariglobus sp.]